MTIPGLRAATPRLEKRAREIVEALGGKWSRGRGMCCCPAHDDRTPSLAIGLGANAILFHCFAGCTSGDVLGAFARHNIRSCELFDGSGAIVSPREAAMEPDANGLRLWREARPLGGTLADIYLSGRQIALRSPALRFHPRTPLGKRSNVRFLPALIAAVATDAGIIAVQRTFLDGRTGQKAGFPKPKRALGSLGSGSVRLSEPRNGKLGLAEGIESALSAEMLTGVPCWATLGNERFGLVAVPDSLRELHLFVDADKGGELARERGFNAYSRTGRAIIAHRPPTQGNDWNDELVAALAKSAVA